MPKPSSLNSAMLFSCKSVLWLLVFSAFGCFGWITFVRPTDWYRTDPDLKTIIGNTTIPFPGDVPVLSTTVIRAGKNTTVMLGRDVPLIAGGNNFPVILQWGSVMVAAACTGLLVAVHRASPTPAPLAPGATSTLRAVWIKLRLFATWPLPARPFWSWFCGGLNLMEVLFAATWAGLAVTYLYFNTLKSFTSVSASLSYLTPPPASPGASPLSAAAQATAKAMLSSMFLTRRLEGFRKASGETLRGLVPLMFFPISRSSFLKCLLGTDFSSLVKYHRWMSWFTLLLSTAHGCLSMILWGSAGEFEQQLDWELHPSNVAAVIALVAFLAIGFTSCAWFRKMYYNIFIHVHLIGFVLFIIFAIIHFNGFIYWIVPALLMYGMDRAFRTWQLASSWTRLRPCDMHCDGSVITLRLPMVKAERVRPGQTVYLYAPGLDWMQTHPFSVAGVEEMAVPEGADAATTPSWAIILHIKATGGKWTRALQQLAAAGNKSLLLQVEGPYDTSLDTPPRSPVVVMIAGGTGITPLLGLLRSYLGLGPPCFNLQPPSTTYLLWTSRTFSEVRLLGADLLAAISPMEPHAANAISIVIDSSSDDSGKGPAARPAALFGTLHYTGCEPCPDALPYLPLPPLGGDPTKAAAPEMATIDSLASSGLRSSLQRSVGNVLKKLGLQPAHDCSAPPRPLAAHPTSRPLVYAASVVLSVFGGYAGLVAAAYCVQYNARTTEIGLSIPNTAVAEYFLVAIGTVFPPLAFLALLSASCSVIAWYKARAVPAPGSSGSSSSSQQDTETGAKAAAAPSKVDAEGGVKAAAAPSNDKMAMAARPLVVGPGYRLLSPSGASKGDQGISLSRGRPDVRGLLRRVRELHAGECVEIEVLVGGPPAMWDAVVDACCDVTFESRGPALRPRRVAHQH